MDACRLAEHPLCQCDAGNRVTRPVKNREVEMQWDTCAEAVQIREECLDPHVHALEK